MASRKTLTPARPSPDFRDAHCVLMVAHLDLELDELGEAIVARYRRQVSEADIRERRRVHFPERREDVLGCLPVGLDRDGGESLIFGAFKRPLPRVDVVR